MNILHLLDQCSLHLVGGPVVTATIEDATALVRETVHISLDPRTRKPLGSTTHTEEVVVTIRVRIPAEALDDRPRLPAELEPYREPGLADVYCGHPDEHDPHRFRDIARGVSWCPGVV